jgi:hypothetical protein
MKMTKGLMILFFSLLSIGTIKAQAKRDSITNITNKDKIGVNYVGINAGTTTGLGLSYAYWPHKNGVQITFIPLIDKVHTYISLGATYLRKVKVVSNNYTFFLFWGNHLTNILSDQKWTFNTGFGPGIEYQNNGFSIHFMIGYGAYNIPDNIMTRPTIELGGFYKF